MNSVGLCSIAQYLDASIIWTTIRQQRLPDYALPALINTKLSPPATTSITNPRVAPSPRCSYGCTILLDTLQRRFKVPLSTRNP
ncbi:MAG TPA: hypothetical protein VIT23_16030, partial [Terrimicrobiaceae bacterium]